MALMQCSRSHARRYIEGVLGLLPVIPMINFACSRSLGNSGTQSLSPDTIADFDTRGIVQAVWTASTASRMSAEFLNREMYGMSS